MEGSKIVEELGLETLCIWNKHLLNKDYKYVFATDLMSDALAMINDNFDSTILVTGLANAQALRTAEMLDLEMIIFVRDKHPDEGVLKLAMEIGFNCFTSNEKMFEMCGKLYELGLKAPK